MFAQRVKNKEINGRIRDTSYGSGQLSNASDEPYMRGLSPQKPLALKLTSQPGSLTKNPSPSDRQDYLAMVTPMRGERDPH